MVTNFGLQLSPCTLLGVKHHVGGPGLRKTSVFPLLARRTVELWQTADYRVREMFEHADVMSEGACRAEDTGRVYYGSTSIVLAVESQGGHIPDDAVGRLVGLLRFNPHARVRAIRIACREAQVRAGVPLGQFRAELTFSQQDAGIIIAVDVEAAGYKMKAIANQGRNHEW